MPDGANEISIIYHMCWFMEPQSAGLKTLIGAVCEEHDSSSTVFLDVDSSGILILQHYRNHELRNWRVINNNN